jgi:ribosome-associated protein
LTPQQQIITAERAVPKKEVNRISRTSKFFKDIINAIEEKKGEEIFSLDLKKIPEAVADMFIICQANSTTQIKAIGDFIEKEIIMHYNEAPYRKEGYQTAQWVLIDYVDIVIHIMQPETRRFYNLEEMWNDANIKKH